MLNLNTVKVALGLCLSFLQFSCSSSSRLSDDKSREDYTAGARAPMPKDKPGNVGTALISLASNPAYFTGSAELKGKCLRGPRDSIEFSVPCKNTTIGVAPLTSDTVLKEVSTDASGLFSFQSLASGQYRVFTVTQGQKEWFGPFTTNKEVLIIVGD